LPHLELGDSSLLAVGQPVIALGDPFLIASENLFLDRVPPDYEPSASLGVISALHRYSDTYSDAIQVDVAVNRGNSGGPLLTLDGKVVGINGKIETRFAPGINTGVGYAIPSQQIQRFLEPLKAAGGGRVLHGAIAGLTVAERADDKSGLPIVRVVQGSAAEKAGFREGDLVLKIAGLPVRTETRYLGILSTYPAGEELAFEVARGAESLEIKAFLAAPGKPYLGIRTQAAEAPLNGVQITRITPQSPAERAKLAVGDVIVAFAMVTVASPPDLARLVGEHNAGDVVTLKVLRGKDSIEVSVRLESR
jgi:serine protease Do